MASVLNEDSNTSLVDKSLNIVSQLNQLKYDFNLEEKYEINRGIQVVEGLSDKLNIDDLNNAKKLHPLRLCIYYYNLIYF